MEGVVRIVLGVLLMGHGLVHLLWFVANDDPAWPFRLDRSWLLSEASRKPAAIALVGLVVASSTLLALAVWGVPGLTSIWPGLMVAAGATSLATLVAFWDRQLVLGVVIDVALIVVALWRPSWTDHLG